MTLDFVRMVGGGVGFAEGKGETDQEPQSETARRWECGGTGPAAQNSSAVLPAQSGNNQ